MQMTPEELEAFMNADFEAYYMGVASYIGTSICELRDAYERGYEDGMKRLAEIAKKPKA